MSGKGISAFVFIISALVLLIGIPIGSVQASPAETAHGAHATSGNGVAATTVYLAEGYTGSGYSNWIAINNVHDTKANSVYVRLYDCNGLRKTISYNVEPRGRRTCNVNAYLPANLEFCTRISGQYNLVADRTTYKGLEGSSSAEPLNFCK